MRVFSLHHNDEEDSAFVPAAEPAHSPIIDTIAERHKLAKPKEPLEAGVLSESVRNEFRATDANSVEMLGQIATALKGSSLPLRRAAAHALTGIHTAQALPYLAALLDDPDPDLRAEGVGGLGAFANGLPVQTSANVPSLGYLQRPASAPYMTKETDANFALGPGAETEPRLSFWKTWWLQNRTSLGY